MQWNGQTIYRQLELQYTDRWANNIQTIGLELVNDWTYNGHVNGLTIGKQLDQQYKHNWTWLTLGK